MVRSGTDAGHVHTGRGGSGTLLVAGRGATTTQVAHLVDLPGLGSVPARPDVSSYHDLVDFVATVITSPTVLVAQSMGGFIALQLALRYPDRVTHLVLAAVTGGVDMSVHRAADWRAEYAASHPQARPWARDQVPDLTDRLHAIAVPVLLLWPARDPLSPLSVASTLASRMADVSLVTFDSDDHWAVIEQPDETALTIERFVVGHYDERRVRKERRELE
jgi:pimeloyl-ACP methyl ester carboxylesterase